MPDTPKPKEIREAYSDYSQATRHNRDEGAVDMRYVSGDPWDPEDRLAREEAHRPCMSFDLIGQYLNQWGASIRKNKRAVKCSPRSQTAGQKAAEKRAGMIRGIEYNSHAQQSYIMAGDNMIQRAAGYCRITTRPVAEGMRDFKSFDKELCIKPIENPDTIIYSPSYRMPDGSDVEEAFEIDFLSKKEYKRRFPKAKIQSFTGEQMGEARNWIREDDIQIAGFWKVHISYRNLLLVEMENDALVPMWEDELRSSFNGRDKIGKFAKMRDVFSVKREMPIEQRKVVQYITNGLEILKEIPWVGQRIPLPACFGKQLFMDLGDGPKRHLFSMVRLARDPQMFHAYAISQEAEEFGLTPRAALQGFVGQFQTDSDAIENSNKVPTSQLQFDVPTDWNREWGAPPLPTRPQYQPNIVSYESAKESSRMSLQSAMGIMPQTNDMNNVDDKSGIALEHIERLEAIGSMHYTENYDMFIENVGWQLNDCLGPVYDTDRHVPIVNADGTQGLLRINDERYEAQGASGQMPGQANAQMPGSANVQMPANPNDPNAQQNQDPAEEQDIPTLFTNVGEFGVAISVGPDHESEHQEAAEFVDSLLPQLVPLQIPPEVIKLILAKAVKMRGVGAIGDEIADLLAPPDESKMPPEVQAVIANMKAQLSQLAQENQALLMDKAGRVQETQAKVKIEGMKQQTTVLSKQYDYITRIVVAEMAKGSKASEIAANLAANKELAMLGFANDQSLAQHQAAHEVGMLAAQPAPEAAAAE